MSFTFTTTIDAKPVEIKLKSFGDAPGRISRHNIGNMEAQVWGYLEWGLLEPANWPPGSNLPGSNVLDVMPQRDITKCYNAWQSASDDEDGGS